MDQAVAGRTPLHLWIVGTLATLWNAFGAYDYLMTRLRNMDYLSSMAGVDANAVLAWIDSFPIWAQFGWGLGVWAGVAGSLLLLLRSRFAVHAFAASLVGMALSFGYQFLGSTPPEGLDGGAMMIVPAFIVIVGVALLYYASRQRERGVLR